MMELIGSQGKSRVGPFFDGNEIKIKNEGKRGKDGLGRIGSFSKGCQVVVRIHQVKWIKIRRSNLCTCAWRGANALKDKDLR